MLRIKQQIGFTLVELMIGMVLAIASMTAISSLVGYGIGVNGNLINSARLSEELGNVYTLLVSDIRRAGYSGDTLDMVTDPNANPSPFNSTITLGAFAGEAANSCITFAYDTNDDGLLDVPGDTYGYRVREGAVEIRRAGADCVTGGWADLTDSDVVNVTELSFTITPMLDDNISSNAITIVLSGELVSNTNFTRTYSSTFVVRNYESI